MLSARFPLVCALVATGAGLAVAEEEAAPVLQAPSELLVAQDPPKVVPRVLDRATPETTRLLVSLPRQRIYLYVDGEVAIDAPVSTGKSRGPTPPGEYSIVDKETSHTSNLHGDFVDAGGLVVRAGVSTRIDAAPSGTVFRPDPVQYFMALNTEGLALYAGRLPGYPASDTAVRLPADIAPLIYQRVKKGTPVKIEE